MMIYSIHYSAKIRYNTTANTDNWHLAKPRSHTVSAQITVLAVAVDTLTNRKLLASNMLTSRHAWLNE